MRTDGEPAPALRARLCLMPRGEKKGKSKFFPRCKEGKSNNGSLFLQAEIGSCCPSLSLEASSLKHLSQTALLPLSLVNMSSLFCSEHTASSSFSATHVQAVESLLLLGLQVLICDQEHRGLLHFQEPYSDLNHS